MNLRDVSLAWAVYEFQEIILVLDPGHLGLQGFDGESQAGFLDQNIDINCTEDEEKLLRQQTLLHLEMEFVNAMV
jgi:hypothetical protein